jgi:DNA-binding NarL/FixJ family response regulator
VAERLTIELIAAELGDELAARIETLLAGQRVYIPERLDEGHFLARTLGADAARALAGLFGGEILAPPTRGRIERRRARIVALARSGMAKRDIAAAVGVTEQYVYRVLARARAEGAASRIK